ncbi:MAG: class I SAM-dependent methyltransferase [Chloroflexota bacterium]|nr:methyltransferase domain-containing protein [Chloroflexia bacterium]MDQ3226554.1 class I SAM-dependent methyltransferase [Chloroflexota bacterium]
MERWAEAYTTDTGIYQAFANAADPEREVSRRVLRAIPYADKTILEIGCGPGGYAPDMAPRAKSYFALDVSEAMIALARERLAGIPNVTILHADAQSIPLADDSMDIIFGTWAIGAIWPHETRESALGDIHRVVKPRGEVWAVESHWQGPFMEMRGKEEQDGDHQTWLWYKSHGFRLVDVIDYAFEFSSLDEAKRILGFIFGEKAHRYLAAHPDRRIGHRAILVHKQVS